ncbi:hypothetical protein [Halomonas sp.]|uniref:hypothetical protein n=1 Tax=Halomonas sp. TaxID=1486246 RepID=UPI00384EAC64
MRALWNRYTVGASALLVAYLAFSAPSDVVVDTDGRIQGPTNHIRSWLQGRGFWQEQMRLAEEEYQELQDEPRRRAAMNQEMNRLMAEADRVIAETDRELGLSSSASSQADRARDRADAIEDAEMQRWLEQMRRERMRDLQVIAQHIQAQF